MNAEQREERVNALEKMIRMEAEEKARMMMDEIKTKANKDKTRLYTYELERVEAEYKEKAEQDKVNKKLEKSRRSNEIKLDMQKYRSELLERLRIDLEESIRETMKNEQKYKTFLKNLILEGLVRLLEPVVKIRTTKADMPLVKSVLEDVKKEYIQFMKEKAEQTVDVEISCFDKAFLPDDVVGGVILYCQANKIVFNNTIRARMDLVIQNSTPDMRKLMFVSLGEK